MAFEQLYTWQIMVNLQTHIPMAAAIPTKTLPCAGGAARGVVCSSLTAQPVAIEIG